MAASEKGHICGSLLVAASEMYNENDQGLWKFLLKMFLNMTFKVT